MFLWYGELTDNREFGMRSASYKLRTTTNCADKCVAHAYDIDDCVLATLLLASYSWCQPIPDRYSRIFVLFTMEFDHVKLLADKYCVNIHSTTKSTRYAQFGMKHPAFAEHSICVKQNTSSSMRLDTFMINESTSAQCIFHEYWACYHSHTQTLTHTYARTNTGFGSLLAT